MISEKLDILMKITDTRNCTLGQALSFDASYISRIRNGKRGIPKHMPFLEPAASYFSKKIKTDHQKKLISEIVCNGKPIPESTKELENILLLWLSENNPVNRDTNSMELLIHELSSFNQTSPQVAVQDSDNIFTNDDSKLKTPSYFFGNSGKREAVEYFLKKLCADNKPHKLLLFSDEDMTWLYEDPVFTQKWAAYLIKLLSTGSHIKIIHTINRSNNELMEAIQKWLPLYKTGYIESYYYPRLRDGVYHRTLFIASDNFAITSNSIGKLTNEMPNTFTDDLSVLKGLKKEFYNLLSLCVPLMKIHKRSTKGIIPLLLKRYENTDSYVYILNSGHNTEDEKLFKEIDDFAEKHPDTTLLNNATKELPENISLIASNNSGVLIISDKLIFDTIEPGFTTAFLKYISRLQTEGGKIICKTIPEK